MNRIGGPSRVPVEGFVFLDTIWRTIELMTRWWFQVFFIFIPTWGNDSNLTSFFFQMGWFNHHLGMTSLISLLPAEVCAFGRWRHRISPHVAWKKLGGQLGMPVEESKTLCSSNHSTNEQRENSFSTQPSYLSFRYSKKVKQNLTLISSCISPET